MALAMLYLEGWYILGSWLRNDENEIKGVSFTIIG